MVAQNFRTITAANSIVILSFPTIFSSHQLQGYASDDAFSTDDADVAETMMGVDGNMSAGYIPFSTEQTYNLQADSLSNDVFENLLAAQKAAQEVFYGSGVISLPGLTRTYTMTKGVLRRISQMPSAGKTLKARKYSLTWQSIDPVGLL